ncbi:MAG TPA: hypothetical protein V6D10_00495 [Trichocoleus sp.]
MKFAIALRNQDSFTERSLFWLAYQHCHVFPCGKGSRNDGCELKPIASRN